MADPPRRPGDLIRDELERRGWTHDDLARILGRHRPEITSLINGSRSVTPEIAVGLAAALGQSPGFWMSVEATHQLSLLPTDGSEVARRAWLYGLAPVKDMERRGWMRETKTTAELEAELCRFFRVAVLDMEPSLSVAARRSNESMPMSVEQRAWVYRAQQIAETMVVPAYNPARLPDLEKGLRALAASTEEAHRIPILLSECGIRLVIIEPLSGGSIDGAAFWLDADQTKPVIAMSIRIDRFDAFWFTLCHELSHIRNRHTFAMDVELVSQKGYALSEVKEEAERQADYEAATMLIPTATLESFIGRVGPLYSKERINQFANRHRIHPAIVVGQLQHRGEIGYSANREMLVKIRAHVLPAAIVDGWGRQEATS